MDDGVEGNSKGWSIALKGLEKSDANLLRAERPNDLLVVICLVVALASEALDGFAIYGFGVRRLLHLVFLFCSLVVFINWRGRLNLFQVESAPLRMALTLFGCAWVYVVLLTLINFANLRQYQEIESIKFILFRLAHFALILYAFAFAYLFASRLTAARSIWLVDLIVVVASVISAFAILDYVAARFGFDLIYRNAQGTGGGELFTKFYYYGYHRAMGGFKEPSHFGAYLAPFYLLAISRQRVILATLIGVAMMLSLSIIVFAVLSLTFTLVSLALLVRGISQKNWLSLSFAVSFISALIAWGLVFSYGADAGGYFLGRYELMAGSDERIPGRDYVFKYILSIPVEIFGQGLGFSILEMSAFFESSLPISFLSFVLNFYVSAGVVGLFVIALAMFLFVIALLIAVPKENNFFSVGIFSSVVSVACVWALLIEEPTVAGVVLFGLAAGWINNLNIDKAEELNAEDGIWPEMRLN